MIRVAAGISVAADTAAASWLRPRLLKATPDTGTLVGSVIPTGFSAYARVFHPADGWTDDEPSLTWREVAGWAGRAVHPQMQWEAISRPAVTTPQQRPCADGPPTGYCPADVRRPLVERLVSHTTTPELCWVCVWEGFGLADAFVGAPRVDLPGRNYILLSATLDAVSDGVLLGRGMHYVGPNLWWPEDRAWCVSTEIDFRWTYVAGTLPCIEDVLADDRLEALITEPDHRGDYLSDIINGPVYPY